MQSGSKAIGMSIGVSFEGRKNSSSKKSTLDNVNMTLNTTVSKNFEFIRTKDRYKLEDFQIKVKLGKGAFGNVYLVELDPALN